MTDKQIIETLRNIKEYCGDSKVCNGCHFGDYRKCNGELSCQINELFKRLAILPSAWDMEEIERIIND